MRHYRLTFTFRYVRSSQFHNVATVTQYRFHSINPPKIICHQMPHPILSYHIFDTILEYFVVGVSPSKMKRGSSFVSGSATAAARLRERSESGGSYKVHDLDVYCAEAAAADCGCTCRCRGTWVRFWTRERSPSPSSSRQSQTLLILQELKKSFP